MEYGLLKHADITSSVLVDRLKVTSSVAESKLLAESTQWPDFLIGQPGSPVRVVLIDDDAQIRHVIARELLGDLRTDLVAQGLDRNLVARK